MKPLNPIMAALLAASAGTLSLRMHASGRSIGAPAVVDRAAEHSTQHRDEDNPINALMLMLQDKDGVARSDAGKRIADFILKADEPTKKYIDDGVDAEKIRPAIQTWVDKWLQEGDLRVATMYFVMGPGDSIPAWTKEKSALERNFIPGRPWEERLRKLLKEQMATADRRIVKSAEMETAPAFLDFAADMAKEVFIMRITQRELETSIDGNDQGNVVNGGSGGNEKAALSGPPPFTTKEIYLEGGEVGKVFNGDEGSRVISLKIYSRLDEEGNPVNELGIFDVTGKNDIYGRRFPLKVGEKIKFALDDRKPGTREYELHIQEDAQGNRDIHFGRPGSKRGEQGTLNTTVEKLLLARADQAANYPTKIGGEEFYVAPQGGEYGTLSFMPKRLVDDRASVKPSELRPQFLAVLTKVNEEGSTSLIRYANGAQLGKVGGKDYRVVVDANGWRVEEGIGDPPPKKVEPKKEEANAGGGSGGQQSSENLEKAGCRAGQGSPLKTSQGEFRIHNCTDENDKDKKYAMIVAPKGVSVRYPDQAGRLVSHHAVLVKEQQVIYLDLLKPVKTPSSDSFEDAGSVEIGKRTSRIKDLGVFMDALEKYMNIKAGSEDAKAPAEVRSKAGGKSFDTFNASYVTDTKAGKDYLLIEAIKGVENTVLWPERTPSGDVPQSSPDQGQPTNAMDPARSSMDAPFPDTFTLKDSRTAKVQVSKGDVALYEAPETSARHLEHYLGYKFFRKNENAPQGKEISMQPPQILVFGSGMALPEKDKNLQLQGLLNSDAALVENQDNLDHRFIAGSASGKKGVFAVFKNKNLSGPGQRSPDENCVGPVLWWGMDAAAAMQACKKDKL